MAIIAQIVGLAVIITMLFYGVTYFLKNVIKGEGDGKDSQD